MTPKLIQRKKSPDIEVEILDKPKSLVRLCEELEKVVKVGVIRVDTDESIRLVLNLDEIEQMPSGICVYPFSYRQKGKDKIVVCKEGEKVKIFKMVEEELR